MNAGSALRAFVLLGGVFLGTAASGQDLQTFADRAASGNRFELVSSQLALGFAQDEEVRAFAEIMMTDHTAAAE